MSDQVGRDPQYEVFADDFVRQAEYGFYNGHYDRPACLALLGCSSRGRFRRPPRSIPGGSSS